MKNFNHQLFLREEGWAGFFGCSTAKLLYRLSASGREKDQKGKFMPLKEESDENETSPLHPD